MDQTGRFLEELFKMNYDRLFRYCMVKLDSDKQAAADCVGDVFLIAKKKAELLMQHPDPVGFLNKAALNCCRNHAKYRRRRLRRFVSLDAFMDRIGFSGEPGALPPPDPLADRPRLSPEELEKLRAEVLSELTNEERELYLMHYEEGLGFDAVGEKLGVSPNAARMRIFRLSDRLRTAAKERISGAEADKEGRKER